MKSEGFSLMILSAFINFGLSIFFSMSRESDVLLIILLILCAIQVIGIIILKTGNLKVGKIIYIIGIFGFVPIGLIGVYGMKKFLDEHEIADENIKWFDQNDNK